MASGIYQFCGLILGFTFYTLQKHGYINWTEAVIFWVLSVMHLAALYNRWRTGQPSHERMEAMEKRVAELEKQLTQLSSRP